MPLSCWGALCLFRFSAACNPPGADLPLPDTLPVLSLSHGTRSLPRRTLVSGDPAPLVAVSDLSSSRLGSNRLDTRSSSRGQLAQRDREAEQVRPPEAGQSCRPRCAGPLVRGEAVHPAKTTPRRHEAGDPYPELLVLGTGTNLVADDKPSPALRLKGDLPSPWGDARHAQARRDREDEQVAPPGTGKNACHHTAPRVALRGQ